MTTRAFHCLLVLTYCINNRTCFAFKSFAANFYRQKFSEFAASTSSSKKFLPPITKPTPHTLSTRSHNKRSIKKQHHTKILNPDEIIPAIQMLNSIQTLDNVELSIELYAPQMTSNWLANCIWNLGTKGIQYDSRQNMTLLLLQSLFDQRHHITSFEVAKSFVGLARMKTQWSNDQPRTLPLYTLLETSISGLQAQGISNIIWSLGVMGASLPSMPLSIKVAMSRRITEISVKLTDQGISNCLWGLAKMDSSWSSLPIFVKSSLCSAICRLSVRMSGQSVANALYSLGTLGVYREGLTERMLIAIEVCIRKSFEKMTSKDIVQTVHGLSLMGFRWDDLSHKTRECISIAVFKQVNKWSSDPVIALREVALLLYSFRMMRTDWNELPSSIRSSIQVALRSICDFDEKFRVDSQYKAYGAYTRKQRRQTVSSSESNDDIRLVMISSAQSYATILHSLAKVNANINTFSTDTKDSLFKCIDIFGSYFNNQAVSMIFYSLGVMQVPINALPDDSVINLLGSIQIFNDQPDELSLSQVLFGLGSMSTLWEKLPIETTETILIQLLNCIPRFNPHMLAMSLCGLAKMGVQFDLDLNNDVRRLLLDSFINAHMTSQDLSVCLRSFANMKVTPQLFNGFSYISDILVDTDASDLVSILYGLSDTRTVWSEISPKTREAIWISMRSNQNAFSPREFSRLMYSFGSLAMRWSDENKILKLICVELIEKHAGALDYRDLGMLLSGLAGMGLLWDELPNSIGNDVSLKLIQESDYFDVSTLNIILASCSRMRCSNKKITEILLSRLDDISAIMSPQDTLKTLQSISTLSINHGTNIGVSSTFQNRLFFKRLDFHPININVEAEIIESQLGSSKMLTKFGEDFSRRLRILATTGIKLNEINKSVRESMFSELAEYLSLPLAHLEFHVLISILNSLRMMKCVWPELPSQLRNQFLMSLSSLYNLDAQLSRRTTLANEVISILRDIGCTREMLTRDSLQDLLRMLLDGFNSKNYDLLEVSQVLEYFKIKWEQLEADSKRNFIHGSIAFINKSVRLNSDKISVVSSSFLSLNAEWDSLPTRPRNELSITLGDLFLNDSISKSVVDMFIQLKVKFRMMTKNARCSLQLYLQNIEAQERLYVEDLLEM